MVKRAPARRRPRKAKPGPHGKASVPQNAALRSPQELRREAAGVIERAGGCMVGSYKEPLGGHPVLLSILPVDGVEPTPF